MKPGTPFPVVRWRCQIDTVVRRCLLVVAALAHAAVVNTQERAATGDRRIRRSTDCEDVGLVRINTRGGVPHRTPRTSGVGLQVGSRPATHRGV